MKIDLKTLDPDFLKMVNRELFDRFNKILSETIYNRSSLFYDENYPKKENYDEDANDWEEWYDFDCTDFETDMSEVNFEIENYIEEETSEDSFQRFSQMIHAEVLDFTGEEIKSQNFFDLIVGKLFKKNSYEKIAEEQARKKFDELVRENVYI